MEQESLDRARPRHHDEAAPEAARGEPVLRRVAATGTAPASTGAVQLRSSGYEVQLFANAIGAGVHPAEQVQRAAARGLSGGSSALPPLAAVQQSFGRHDVSAVQADVGGRAAEGAAALG